MAEKGVDWVVITDVDVPDEITVLLTVEDVRRFDREPGNRTHDVEVFKKTPSDFKEWIGTQTVRALFDRNLILGRELER